MADKPPGSLAKTVTTAVPGATPAIVRILPDTETAAIPTSETVAAYARASPSASLKNGVRSTDADWRAEMVWAGMEPTPSGA